MIFAIVMNPGTIMAIGLKSDLRLSGSSVLPAYPGFIVMKITHECCTAGISLSSKYHVSFFLLIASKIVETCWATTESTSISILLNSSNQPKLQKRQVLRTFFLTTDTTLETTIDSCLKQINIQNKIFCDKWTILISIFRATLMHFPLAFSAIDGFQRSGERKVMMIKMILMECLMGYEIVQHILTHINICSAHLILMNYLTPLSMRSSKCQ